MMAALALLATAQAPDEFRKLSDKDAVQELAIFADCVAERRAERSRTLALAPYGSDEQADAADRVYMSVDDDCIRSGFDSVRMTFRPDVLAGAIARSLVLRDYPDFATVVDPGTVDAEAERQRAAQLSVAERFGRCIVWNDPAGIQALLRATPGSEQEKHAVAALQQAMGMCLEEGNTLRLDRSFVRTVTATAAYRLAHQLRPRGDGPERG